MSPCLNGGGRTTYILDLEIIKPPSSALIRAHSHSPSSSPSSTISESSNSPKSISTRKPRTARKRPNQKYNEAAALLSTACPNIFSTKDLLKPCKFSKVKTEYSVLEEAESAELLIPFLPFDEKPIFQFEHKPIASNQNQLNCVKFSDGFDSKGDDFDAESMLDEEIEQGIDSIMGSMIVSSGDGTMIDNNLSFGYPFMGLGFDFGSGNRSVSAFRGKNQGEWCGFPVVNVGEISPRLEPKLNPHKKKKKKKVEDIIKAVDSNADSKSDPKTESPVEDSASKESNSLSAMIPKPPQLLLKLNHDDVLKAWSDRGSPFSDDSPALDGIDTATRLAQIDLFGENGGVGVVGAGIGGIREASVLRYKEKRRTRLFSKKIRYQVRKVNADQRPRMKGRFVRTPDPIATPTDRKRSKTKSKS